MQQRMDMMQLGTGRFEGQELQYFSHFNRWYSYIILQWFREGDCDASPYLQRENPNNNTWGGKAKDEKNKR